MSYLQTVRMENLAHSLYIFQFLYSNKSANYQKKSIKLKLWQFLIVCLNNDHMKNTILWGTKLNISEPNLLDLYHIMQKRSSSELFLNFIQVLKYDRTRTIYAIP
ncbi:hypothetical protein HZS_7239 [Henneguya salminicola]|nr:hypothetical protein HZS_7239 [Henneguya salminicola]